MSVDLRTEINDCEDVTGFTDSNKAPSADTLAGQFYEGAGDIATQHTNTGPDEMDTTQLSGAGGTFSFDLSDATVYVLMKNNLVQSFANEGTGICIGDGTNKTAYRVGGSDAPGLDLTLYYRCFKLDVSVIVTTPGTFTDFTGTEASLVQSTVTAVGYSSIHNAKAQGNISNVFLDRMTYIVNGNPALRINGGTVGTPETMADVQGDDVTNGWGMINNPVGTQYGFFAPVQWGESAAATDSYFTATDEQWFWIGDNNGGHVIGAGNFDFSIAGTGANTHSFVITRVVIVSTGAVASFDLSDADVDFMQIEGCVFTDLGVITMPANITGDTFCNNTVFNNCAQAILNNLVMDSCTFNGTTDALGAIFWDTAGDEVNQDNLTFNSDGTGHAISISLNTASLTTFNIDGYTVSGYEAADDGSTGNTVFIVDNALDGDVDINVTGGVGTFSYERAAGYTGTVDVIQSVTLTVQVNDANGNGIGGASVHIEEDPGGTLVSQGTADGTGEHTDSFSGATPQLVLIKTRLKGYKNFRTTGTITGDGLAVTATMLTDSVVDLP